MPIDDVVFEWSESVTNYPSGPRVGEPVAVAPSLDYFVPGQIIAPQEINYVHRAHSRNISALKSRVDRMDPRVDGSVADIAALKALAESAI